MKIKSRAHAKVGRLFWCLREVLCLAKRMTMSIKNKLFFSYAAVICVQLLIVWIAGFYYVSDTLEQKYNEEFNATCSIIYKEVNDAFRSAFDFINLIQSSRFVGNLATAYYEPSDFEIVDYGKTFTSNMQMSSVVDEAFIYFPLRDIVISSFSLIENSENFLSGFIDIGGYTLDEKEDLINNCTQATLLLKPLHCGIQQGEGLFMLWPYSGYGTPSAAPKIGIVVFMDKRLGAINFPIDAKTQVLLYKDGDSYCFSNSEEIIPLSGDEWRQVSETSRAGETRIDFKNKSYYISGSYVGTGVSCLIVTERSPFVRQIGQLQLLMILFLLVMLLFGLLLIHRISLQNVRPILAVYNLLRNRGRTMGEGTVPLNEITYIEHRIEEIVDSEQSLRQEMEHSKTDLCSYYLSKLMLTQQPSMESLQLGLSIAGIQFPYPNFVVCVIRCKDAKALFESYNRQCQEGNFTYSLYADQDWIILVNFTTNTQLSTFIQRLSQNLIFEETEEGIFAGGNKNTLADVHESYLEAQQILENRFLRRHNRIIQYQQSSDKRLQNYYFPRETELVLVEYLRQGEFDKANKVLAALIHENVDVQNLPFKSVRNFYVHILIASLKAVPDQGSELHTVFSVQQVFECTNHNQMITLFDTLMAAICQQNSERTECRVYDPLVQGALDYIDHHFTNASLSLSEVADKLSVHKVYLSKLFNQQVKCGFVEYVNRKRVEHSIVYLFQEQYKIVEASELSGFSSEVTYRREFKKYMHMSPGQYRKQVHFID